MYAYLSLKHFWYTRLYSHMKETRAHIMFFDKMFIAFWIYFWHTSLTHLSPGVGRNTFLSTPHLCFITVFICDLLVSRDDPLMS